MGGSSSGTGMSSVVPRCALQWSLRIGGQQDWMKLRLTMRCFGFYI